MMVCRNWEWDNQGHTISVYNLEFDEKELGDKAVFISLGYSRMTSIVGLDSAQGNCIYYTKDDYIYNYVHLKFQEFTTSRNKLMSDSPLTSSDRRSGFGLVMSNSIYMAQGYLLVDRIKK